MVSKARVELYIGASDGELNKKRYDSLFSRKEEIEKEYGEPWSGITKRAGNNTTFVRGHKSVGLKMRRIGLRFSMT